MKREKGVLSGRAVAVRSGVHSGESSTSLRRDGASINRAGDFLNSVRQGCAVRQDLYYLRQGTASAVPKDSSPSGVSTPEERVVAAAIYSTHVPSKFRSNSLKTKKSGPHYSTHKLRGHERHFRTEILTDPSKLQQVQVD
jgi:hypothetical protein